MAAGVEHIRQHRRRRYKPSRLFPFPRGDRAEREARGTIYDISMPHTSRVLYIPMLWRRRSEELAWPTRSTIRGAAKTVLHWIPLPAPWLLSLDALNTASMAGVRPHKGVEELAGMSLVLVVAMPPPRRNGTIGQAQGSLRPRAAPDGAADCEADAAGAEAAAVALRVRRGDITVFPFPFLSPGVSGASS